MWGLACQRISSGAPASTNRCSTWRDQGLLMFVVSLPSENVPAPAFAELDVRVRVELAAGVERFDSGQALVDRRAALDDKRAQAGARQVQRAKQARGARAHHDGARLGSGTRRGRRLRNLQRLVGLVRLHVRARLCGAAAASMARGFGLAPPVANVHAEGGHEVHVVLLARVDAALEQADFRDVAAAGR